MDLLETKGKLVKEAIKELNELHEGLVQTAEMKMHSGAIDDESIMQGSFGSGDSGMEDMSKETAALKMQEADQVKEDIKVYEQYKFEKPHEVIEPLALVKTNKGNFFITKRPLNKIKVDGEFFFMIAPTAPIYGAMEGKKKGDSFSFNGNEFKIEELA